MEVSPVTRPLLTEPGEQETCWICFDSSSQSRKLVKPCLCPRYVHSACLAQWQVSAPELTPQQEHRLSREEYPPWTTSITPVHLQPNTAQVQPWMAVICGDEVVNIAVRPGPQGLEEFQETIRRLFGFTQDCDIEVTFQCRTPLGGAPVTLHGFQCYDAAAVCAAISANSRVVMGEGTDLA
ncbi:hypothetical protein VOLCADRAFT_59577 [Volvox carteri f. nagariensis]|uniref:RING-CH-type domain-containing protein n=1 Tax=Volvox carteri f. nagariensis TaxID=3068 RepID=D8TTB9_VOLCA|nr:uncharacterized protein VOLCADRAFT_59577 [Volvox carteri f. nagariensis]EFJ49279.1 hypothetical protein VOLCADRAFT_59577 [Volvox carteri f. nagariensis]|eukprot:XP_002949727.1 hypothetical protein VOLCADRAFT_59577 [Volvox carteri f. nagariensis]